MPVCCHFPVRRVPCLRLSCHDDAARTGHALVRNGFLQFRNKSMRNSDAILSITLDAKGNVLKDVMLPDFRIDPENASENSLYVLK